MLLARRLLDFGYRVLPLDRAARGFPNHSAPFETNDDPADQVSAAT